MKMHTVFIGLFVILLITSPLVSAIESQAVNAKNTATTSGAIVVASEQSYNPDNSKKTGSIDGTTSASKLSAQRSHYVSKHDETGLSIFLGLIILCLIGFFLKPFR